MERDLELLYEAGCFRRVRRSWEQFLYPDAASNTDHTFRVMWTALTLAKHEKCLDTDRILKMALLHDLPESRTGDTNYLSRQYVSENSTQAVKDIFQETILEFEFTEIWQEYELRQSMAAKIVKDADTLDVDLELSEALAMGNKLGGQFVNHRKLVAKSLYTDSAKKLWDKIQSANPHDWHLNSRNRYNAGDWKVLRD